MEIPPFLVSEESDCGHGLVLREELRANEPGCQFEGMGMIVFLRVVKCWGGLLTVRIDLDENAAT
jgi:hypothetical protein